MLKVFIKLRKYFWLKPRWRILRIYTKTLPREKIENLRDVIKRSLVRDITPVQRAYLKGKLEILDLLLYDERKTKKNR